jgi:hypothetical protein
MTQALIGHYPKRYRECGLGRLRFANEVAVKGTRQLSIPTPEEVLALKSVVWPSTNQHALDQGSLGACTGFAVAQCASTEAFGNRLLESDAVAIYSRATQLDPFEGSYPPFDTGSTGWAAMTAAVERGLFSGFSVAENLFAVLLALQTRPGVTGADWFQGGDTPSVPLGIIAPTGPIEGGHEYMLAGCEIERRADQTIDIEHSYVVHRNSWGDGYGVSIEGATGYFRMSFPQYMALLVSGADAHFPDLP